VSALRLEATLHFLLDTTLPVWSSESILTIVAELPFRGRRRHFRLRGLAFPTPLVRIGAFRHPDSLLLPSYLFPFFSICDGHSSNLNFLDPRRNIVALWSQVVVFRRTLFFDVKIPLNDGLPSIFILG